MECEPTLNDDVVYEAVPPLVNAVVLPLIGAPLSRKVTFPVGVPPVELLTNAVMRTDWPTADGLGEEPGAMNVGVLVGVIVFVTVCVITFDVLGEKFASPEYMAAMG